MKIVLKDIKNTKPVRGHGNIEELNQSIKLDKVKHIIGGKGG